MRESGAAEFTPGAAGGHIFEASLTMRPITAGPANAQREFLRWARRRALLIGALGLIAVLGVLADLTTGPAGLPVAEAIRSLTGWGEVARATDVIVWDVRLPVALMAPLIGAALGLAGAEMQTVLENPLAEPFTLGVSSVAALGAGLVLVLGIALPGVPQAWTVSANAFVFALGSLLLLQALARLRGNDPKVLILFGIALNFAAGACLSLLQFIATPDALQALAFWSMGSLAGADWPQLGLLALVLAACAPFSLLAATRMTALTMGEEQARSFGVDVARLRRTSLLRVSLLAGAAVSMVGVVGFVGLAGPHIARLLVGEDHRFFVPASILTGAGIMSLASIAAKLLVPGVLLPVGLVTSLIGLPVFISLILRDRGVR